MSEMKYVSYLLALTVLFVFVSEADQAPVGRRLRIYEDSSCTKYFAESNVVVSSDPGCTPYTCASLDGRYATLECNADLSYYPTDQTLGVALYEGDPYCNTSLSARYLATPNATGLCLGNDLFQYFIVTTNACPNRTVVDVYQFKINGKCQTIDRHWDGNVGQCTLGVTYYADAICPVQPVPVSPPVAAPVMVPVTVPIAPVAAPVDAPIEAPVTVPVIAPVDAPVAAPVDAPVDAPTSEPIASTQPVTTPVKETKSRLSAGSFVPVCFSLTLLLSMVAL